MNTTMGEGINEYSKIVNNILDNYSWSENDHSFLTDNITELIKKVNDNCMNLGIVGSFSSGKSTMLNSLMCKNLLVTDAVQGTTVSTTKIKHAAKNDLIIYYNNKNVLRFSTDKEQLCKKYDVAYKLQSKSPWKIFIYWLMSIFNSKKNLRDMSSNVSDIPADMMEIFTKVTSIEEFAVDINLIVLEYMNEKLPQDIALVDTPGTESTNNRHLVMTQTAIDYICDAVVIIIPYDEPVSQTLVQFLNNSLSSYLDKCIFVVTKIELLDDITELPRLLKTIEKRLINNLNINNPIVLGLPTLLHLENADTEMKPTGLFNSMDAETKTELLELYSKNNDILWDILIAKKRDFILNKINTIRTRIQEKLIDSLEINANQKKTKRLQIEQDIPKPLSVFIDEANKMLREMCIESRKGFEQRPQLYVTVIDDLLSNTIRTIESCDNSQQIITILTGLNGLIGESFEIITSSMVSDEEKHIFEHDEFLKQIYSEFLSTYSMCLLPTQSNVPMDNYALFRGGIYAAYEHMALEFYDSLSYVIYTIGASTSGIKNKLKSLFSNSTQKNIDYSVYELRSIMGIFADKAKEAIQINVDGMLNFHAVNTENKINMYDILYSKMVNDYIVANNGEISILRDEESKISEDLKSITDLEKAITNSIITLNNL